MIYHFCLGEEKESDDYSNRISSPLNLFSWLSHLMMLAENTRQSTFAELENISGTDTSVLMDNKGHLGGVRLRLQENRKLW